MSYIKYRFSNVLATISAVASETLGDRLKLHWLRDHIEALPRDNRWRTLARSALRDDVYSQQAALTAEILRSVPDELPARERIDAWVKTNSG